MPLTNEALIEQHTGIRTSAAAKAFLYAADAERTVRAQVTDAVYDSVVAGEPGPDKTAVTRAESFLSLYHALQVLNMRPADKGGLLKMIGQGDYTEELMGQFQLNAIRGAVFHFAVSVIEYLIPDPLKEDGTVDEQLKEASFRGNGFALTAGEGRPDWRATEDFRKHGGSL